MSCGTTHGGCNHDCSQGHTCPGRGAPPSGPVNLPVTWLLVVLFLIALAYVGPTIDDHSAEHDQALALGDALKAEQAKGRFAKAAQQICGENGAWRDLGGGAIQCYTHRGARTITAKVTP